MLSTNTPSYAEAPCVEVTARCSSRTAVHRLGCDWRLVLDAVHTPDAGDESWAAAIAQCLERIVPSPVGVGVVAVHHHPAFDAPRPLFHRRPRGGRGARMARTLIRELTSVCYPYRPVVVRRKAASDTPDTERFDAIGVAAYPMADTTIVAYLLFGRRLEPGAHDRDGLARLALHIESAYLHRRKPESVVARVSEEGALLATAGDTIDLWPDLVSGTCVLVEDRHEGGRTYLVVRTPMEVRRRRALTPHEREAVAMAVRGLPIKVIAHELGTTSSGASSRLALAGAKIGVATCTELLRLAACRPGADATALVDAELTSAERDVLSMVRSGMSNAAIANERSRSVRTVANQVASLLRKTGAPSRRALLSRPRSS